MLTTSIFTDSAIAEDSNPSNDDDDEDSNDDPPGSETQPCVDGECLGSLVCLSKVCVDADGTSSPTSGNTSVDTATDPIDPSTEPGVTSTGPDPSTGPSDPGTETTDGTGTTETTADPSSDPSSDPDTTDSADTCKSKLYDAEPPAIVLLLDKSGSMQTADFDHDNNPQTAPLSPWTSLRARVVADLPVYAGDYKIGMGLFPSLQAQAQYNATGCLNNSVLEVAIAYGSDGTISSALPVSATAMAGGGPLTAAMAVAVNALKQQPASTPRAIIVFTDSPANCWGSAGSNAQLFEFADPDLKPAVDAAFKVDRITTYVVGIQQKNMTSDASPDGVPDNVNGHVYFNELATVGGRPRAGATKYWPMNTNDELATAFNATFADAQGCHLVLDAPPMTPAGLKIEVGGAEYGYDPGIDCVSQNGWEYIDASHKSVRLCGVACDALRVSGAAWAHVDC